mmetsp:Transcript_13649/g.23967  ORF Transcript_13649/g.23967 Transcript_13649/m.23967 type:complete len:634 (-) Transcript_13649:125-2026(-)
MKLIRVLGLFLGLKVVLSFPESGDPITEEPKLNRPNTETYVATIFENAPCSSWDLILTSQYTPPPSSSWSRVILDFSASENGTQYDRYGAFWLGGVELLRTTTAEPTAEGIVWRVEKDVTAYLDLFLRPSTASLSIPNNVDSTYTGVPLVNITLTFYAADEAFPAVEEVPTVLPLSNNPGNWTALDVSGGSNLTFTTTLPYNDVVGVALELMASPHGCEEFWYTNIDSEDAASKFGLCGGGVYRELQVYVDGRLAGAIYPFPVIYTGGINPFLWRPLTGIMSFDIPAYSFDLSPFVLGDGHAHEITLKVLGGDTEGGVWYLDATLLLYRDASAAPVAGGLVDHSDSGTNLSTNSSASTTGYSWDTHGTHKYSARGNIIKASTSASPVTVTAEVSGALDAWNTNAITSQASVQITNGALSSEHSNSLHSVLAATKLRSSSGSAALAVNTRAHYPYKIWSSYKQDATTFDMSAYVNISYQRENTYPAAGDSPTLTVAWRNSLLSNAAYNRTLDHTTVYVESDTAIAGYHASSNGKPCYQRIAQGSDGFVVEDTNTGECHLPQGKYLCGYELCSGPVTVPASLSASSPGQVDLPETLYLELPTQSSGTVRQPIKTAATLPLVRHPLMGRSKLQTSV